MATKPRTRTISLFKVAGVQVDIDFSWLAIFALILWSLSAGYFPGAYPGHATLDYWVVGFVATLLFFSSVLTHELSHAAVGNRLGEKIDRITLFIFGGMAHLSGEPRNANDEIMIAGVGPLTSIALGILFWLIYRTLAAAGVPALWSAVFHYLSFINIALALFNLLPGFPLDGGRLFRAMMWKRTGDLDRATARAADWGNTLAWGMMAFGGLQIFTGALVGGLWLIFIGLFLRSAAMSEYQGTVIGHLLQRIRVGDIMTRDPVTLSPDTSVADAVEQYFLKYGYGGFPVVADGRVVGTLSLSQVRHCSADERAHKKVADIMRPLDSAVSITPQVTAMDAVHKMNEATSGRLVVIDNDKLVGLITQSAVMRFMQIRAQLESKEEAK
ncbi:MAG: M50 family metallopeptidase [Candidatus Binataceae bacterium]